MVIYLWNHRSIGLILLFGRVEIEWKASLNFLKQNFETVKKVKFNRSIPFLYVFFRDFGFFENGEKNKLVAIITFLPIFFFYQLFQEKQNHKFSRDS